MCARLRALSGSGYVMNTGLTLSSEAAINVVLLLLGVEMEGRKAVVGSEAAFGEETEAEEGEKGGCMWRHEAEREAARAGSMRRSVLAGARLLVPELTLLEQTPRPGVVFPPKSREADVDAPPDAHEGEA